MKIKNFRDLHIWKRSVELVENIYKITKTFPKEELFGLVSQMRRSAVSVPANIVEGCARRTDRDYDHFLNISFGSVRELGYYIDLARRLEYLGNKRAEELSTMQSRVAAALASLIRTRRKQ